MKKLFIIIAILFSNTVFSQEMKVHKTNGTDESYILSEIDSITFSTVNILFQDDFESYQANTFPSSGGWVSGPGTNNDIISNSVFHSPNQSFKLNGVGGDPGCYRPMSTFPTVTYFEIWIKTPSNTAASDTGAVAFGVRFYFAINFVCKDNTVRLSDYNTGTGPGLTISTFQPDLWYKVKVKFDKSSNKVSCWIDDVQKILNATISPYPSASLDFGCSVQNLQKEAYLDDLVVWY